MKCAVDLILIMMFGLTLDLLIFDRVVNAQTEMTRVLTIYVSTIKQPDDTTSFTDIQSAINFIKLNSHKYDRAVVEIKRGRYVLSSTLSIDLPKLVEGSMTLEIRGESGSSVTISGSSQTVPKEWKQSATNPKICIFSNLNFEGGFSALYASDGEPRIRSRHPNLPNFYEITGVADPSTGISAASGFSFVQGLSPSWDYNQIEVVGLQMYRAPRLRVNKILNSFNGVRIVEFSNSASGSFGVEEFSPELSNAGYRYRFYTENVNFVDYPGEWYFDSSKKELIYFLKNNESCNMNGAIVNTISGEEVLFYIPNSQFANSPLIQVGSEFSYQKNLTIRGISFAHAGWKLGSLGYKGAQALSPRKTEDSFLVPAVKMFCSNCAFVNNTISQVGGHGIHVYGHNILIKQNRLKNVGGNGIIIGDRFEYKDLKTSGARIWDNILENIGLVHNEGVGIISFFSGQHQIAHNRISNIAYSGISMGWDWISQYVLVGKNQVFKNEITNTLQRLNDGGAIYIVGNHPSSSINDNYISSSSNSPHLLPRVSFLVYFDRGTSGINVEKNLIVSNHLSSLKLSRSFENKIKNNFFLGLGQQTSPFIIGYEKFRLEMPLGNNNQIVSNLYYRPEASTQTDWLEQSGKVFNFSDYNLFYSKFGEELYGTEKKWSDNFERNSLKDVDPLITLSNRRNVELFFQSNSPLSLIGIEHSNYSNVGPRFNNVGAGGHH